MASDEKFLLFDDYLQNPDPQGWVTVLATADRSQEDSRFVFAALASPDSVPDLLKTPEHEVNSTRFGIPTFGKSGDRVSFKPAGLHSEDVRMVPFVFKRNFHGTRPDTCEIAQNFVLYHNLSFDREQKAYVDLEHKPIVRIRPSRVQVQEDALRDYLAAHEMVLVLYYHHYRQRDAKMADVFGAERLDLTPGTDDSNYSLAVGHFLDDKRKSLSVLSGKRIVRPYAEPLHADYDLALDRPENYETYVCSENGERVEKSCDIESGRQRGPYLTPVFFAKKVLSKYRDSSLYEVGNGAVSCLDSWYIDFGQSGELVRVWLGDLGRIPYKEQRHWRLHNVAPQGGFEENFARRQQSREPAQSNSGCETLIGLKSEVNANFERRFGFRLFKNLRSRGTRTPHDLASDEESDFNEQISSMAESLVESINLEGLKPGKTTTLYMPIPALEQFLVEQGLAPEKAKETVGAFHMVQKLRPEGAAHAGGRAYAEALRDYGLDELGPNLRFGTVIEKLTAQLSSLKAWLESKPSPQLDRRHPAIAAPRGRGLARDPRADAAQRVDAGRRAG